MRSHINRFSQQSPQNQKKNDAIDMIMDIDFIPLNVNCRRALWMQLKVVFFNGVTAKQIDVH